MSSCRDKQDFRVKPKSRQAEEAVFFFEKKNQKTFAPALCRPQFSSASPWSEPNRQKFFGSFFKK